MSCPETSPAAIPDRLSLAEFHRASAAGLVRLPGQAKARRRRPKGGNRPALSLSEEDIQRSCIGWATLATPTYPFLAWLMHTPNGGKRSKGEAGKMKAMGVKPGYPDLTVPLRNEHWTGLAVEMKSATGRLSPEQQDWLAVLAASGWLTIVARSLEEFIAAVTAYHTGAVPENLTRHPANR